MTSPDDVRERAFEAGTRTRGTVEAIKTTATKLDGKLNNAIGGTVESAQYGFKAANNAVVDSGTAIVSTVLQNPKGKRASLFSAFWLSVIFFGFLPASFFWLSVLGGLGKGIASGKPANTSDNTARVSSYVGTGINKVLTVSGQAIGEVADSAYQYQPAKNVVPISPTGGNIRAGTINPYPAIVPIQGQQPIAINQQIQPYYIQQK